MNWAVVDAAMYAWIVASARSEMSSARVRAPERWLGAVLVAVIAFLAVSSRRQTRGLGARATSHAVLPSPSLGEVAEARSSRRASAAGRREETNSTVRGRSGEGAVAPSPVTVAMPSACPPEMVLVDGSSCPKVEHTCTRWLDDKLLPYARCAEYETSARCVGERLPLRFCIDAREYTPPGESLPQNYSSFVLASRACDGLGKRICLESEWNFACEGPNFWPYPYGFDRNGSCNQDLLDLYETNPRKQVLKDQRVPSGSLAGCKSPFGVYDMVGNLDEPVLVETQRYAYPHRNALKGGWWMAGRNRCRPSTTAHSDHYRDIQVGIRCCRDALPPPVQ